MKKIIPYIMFVCLFVCPSYATHYEITTDIYTPGLTLESGDSLYMTDGGFGSLNLWYNSFATIEGTSTLVEGSGGIWTLGLLSNSHVDMSGGQVHEIVMSQDATAYLTGGLIQGIWSQQYTTYGPHITVLYSGDLPTYNETTNLLTGLWGSSDPFSIYLQDVSGYSPAIDNIQFQLIPEPATFCLMGAGILLLRKRRTS